MEAAQVAIRSAKTEAICNMPNGIGVGELTFSIQTTEILDANHVLTTMLLICLSKIDGSFGRIPCR